MASSSSDPWLSAAQVVQILEGLIAGEVDRAEATDWAQEQLDLIDDWELMGGARRHNEVVWEALLRLAGADAPSIDREYLYDVTDFADWLVEMRADQDCWENSRRVQDGG